MDDIATEAKTSKTVLYRHFGDRLGLYQAVCESVDGLLTRELDMIVRGHLGVSEFRLSQPSQPPASSGGSADNKPTGAPVHAARGSEEPSSVTARDTTGGALPTPGLTYSLARDMIETYLTLVERDPEVYLFVVGRGERMASGDPVKGLRERLADSFARLLAHLDAQVSSASARMLAWAMVGLVDETADEWIRSGERLPRGELAALLADFTIGGLPRAASLTSAGRIGATRP